MSPVITTPTEPRRTLEAAAAALRSWTPRQHLAAAMFSVAFALLIGVPTVLIPNPVFGRQVPVQAWSYPVWIASSILGGMLAATYVLGARDQAAVEVAESVDAPSRLGMAGGLLAWSQWKPVQMDHAALLLALAVTGFLGQLTINEAFRSGQASAVAPFEYTALAWGVALDWLIWQTLPEAHTWFGAAIIIGSGLYLVRREKRISEVHATAEHP